MLILPFLIKLTDIKASKINGKKVLFYKNNSIMSYYFIAQIKINDENEYQKYIDNAGKIFSRYKGKYLSIDNNPKILEGKWNYSRTVLIEFENKDEFNAWYDSPEYQSILKFRLMAADCDSILVKGLEGN
ncbi:MAG: DUF1330 domain-containing protein [Bacteroidetes bacterium HGW-Bacteroidetes-17]|nr:MAG: DUF1330 domain-containing protein [Bacteroidetes bacterium HGW-Bacteroidetes-17]